VPIIAFSPKRWLKIAIVFLVVATGTYAVWSAQGFVVSDNAVVSAYVVSLRTPIEGYVSGSPTQVGSEIGRGDVLATVINPRVDDQRLADLQDRVQRLILEKSAIARQRETLDATRQDLLRRAEAYRGAVLARLSGQIEAAGKTLEAKTAESEQAKHDYARKVELARSGTASAADLDKARYVFEALDGQARSLVGLLAAVRAEQDAATHGVMIDAGGNDVVYSAQRADELRIRIAELDRAYDTATADGEEASARVALEARRIGLLRSASMAAPSDGMVWKVGSSDGERLGTGDTTAQLIDCGAAFLVAAVPQSAYTDVVLGGEARFRLSGETAERTGTIISVIGDTSLLGDRNLAAVPIDQHRPTAMVRIAVPPSRNVAAQCLVGRTARVLLPTTEHSLVDQAVRLVRHIL
jgi:multidrug resistance efflux pump